MKFESYHPIIQFIYFVTVLTCTILFDHPVFMALAYVVSFAWSVKLNGRRAVVFNICLIPCLLLYAAWYASYHHFGVTNLWQNRIGNWITLESILYGLVLGIKIATIFMEFSCIFVVVTLDKVVYLLGRISPNLSLFFSILLRSVPRVKRQIQKISTARHGMGKGICQGNIVQRFFHCIEIGSIIITWCIEQWVECAASMKARGYSLKGRTAFSMYRFENGDRGVTIGLICCMMLIYIAYSAGVTNMLYNPMVCWNPVAMGAIASYIIYSIFLLIPFEIEMIEFVKNYL